MKIPRIFGWTLVGLAIIGGVYYVKISLPCERPITYRIGTFDNRFDISQADFLQAVDRASDVWSESIDKELFKYDPRGEVVVNLIYDERQATTERTQEALSKIDQTEKSAEAIKTQFLSLQQSYDDRLAEYNKLISQRKSFRAIEEKRREVNVLVDEINTLAHKYNSLVNLLDADIKTINQSAGQEFEEGEYISNAEGQQINIYEFKGRTELLRVLAHEFGHALGLGHNDNPQSIMYYLNQSTNESLTPEDLQALKTLCGAT